MTGGSGIVNEMESKMGFVASSVVVVEDEDGDNGGTITVLVFNLNSASSLTKDRFSESNARRR